MLLEELGDRCLCLDSGLGCCSLDAARRTVAGRVQVMVFVKQEAIKEKASAVDEQIFLHM